MKMIRMIYDDHKGLNIILWFTMIYLRLLVLDLK